MLVADLVNTIKTLQNSLDYNDNQIAREIGITIKKLREYRMLYEIFYKDTEVKNNEYLKLAIEFKKLEDKVYFPVELARMTNTSTSTTSMICKMFNVKPSKKAFCKHCGAEVEVKTTAIPKFCNSVCRYKHKGDK